MREQVMLELLERFIWLIERNRFVEARRLVERELENIKGITEKKCKLYKENKEFCKLCKNYNCNLNKNNK